MFSRRIGIATLPHSQPPVEPRVCECAMINSCPADKRDYITFRWLWHYWCLENTIRHNFIQEVVSFRTGAMLHRQTLPVDHIPASLPRQHGNHEDNIPEHSLSGWNSKVESSFKFSSGATCSHSNRPGSSTEGNTSAGKTGGRGWGGAASSRQP